MVTWNCTGRGSSSLKKDSKSLKPHWQRLKSQRLLRCMLCRHRSFAPTEPRETLQLYAPHAARKNRDRRWTSDRGAVWLWNPRLVWSEKTVSMRHRFAYQRQAASAVALWLTTDPGAGEPVAQPHRTMLGPDASRVPWPSLHAISRPGVSPPPHASRRQVAPAHDAPGLVAVRHA